MKNNKLHLFILFNILLVFHSCSPQSGQPTQHLNIPLSSQVSTLDPANSYDTISAVVFYQGHEQLYEYYYLKRPYTLKPLLAKAMPTVSDEGKTYTINIKENIRYHDHPIFNGEPRYLKAEDFVTQIKRIAFEGTQSNGWWLLDHKIKGLNEFRKAAGNDLEKMLNLEVEGLIAKDEHTLVIKLNEPLPQFPYILALSFTSPVPKELVIYKNNILDDLLIGTGPFKLDQWKRDKYLTMKRFEHYHEMYYPTQGDRRANSQGFLDDAGKKIPFLDSIKFKIIKENHLRWKSFIEKELDFLAIPRDNHEAVIDPSGRLSRAYREKNLTLQVVPSLTYWWLSFNMNDPIVGNNLYLRKAIAHAIDSNQYVDIFTSNIGQRANSIYPPGIAGYDPAHRLPYEFNLEKAKKYLAKAGYPNGKGLPPITYDVRGASQTNQQQALYIKRELAKIGITIIPSSNPFPIFLEQARKGELQFWLDGWALDYPDAKNILQLLITNNHPPGPNATFYSNSNFDELFEKFRFLPDGPEKVSLMKKMEEIVHEDLPWIMLYYSRDYILQHQHVRNYRHSDIIYNYAKYIRVK